MEHIANFELKFRRSEIKVQIGFKGSEFEVRAEFEQKLVWIRWIKHGQGYLEAIS